MTHTMILRLTLDLAIADDVTADCLVEPGTVVDIAVGETGYVGRILQIVAMGGAEAPPCASASRPPAILPRLRVYLARTAATRLPLCPAHTQAARDALPYPAQGVHLRVLQRPVDVVAAAQCCVCQGEVGAP